jgi:YVTN family beta-propeller protein
MKQLQYRLVPVCVLLIIFLFSATECNAQSRLLALSKTDHTLAIVDPVTLKVLGRAPVGSDPHEVVAAADGKTAYVSIYGGGSLHELNVIDLVAMKALNNIDTRPLFGPHGLTFVEGKVWFTVEGSKAVGRYDPATKNLDWCMGTVQDRTHMIYVTDNAKKIYTTNVASGTISILVDTLMMGNPPTPLMKPPVIVKPGESRPLPTGGSPHKYWQQTIIPTAKGAEGFDVSPDGSELWTASSETGSIFIIDLSAKKVSATIDAKVFGANRLKFTPDGSMVFISSLSSGALTIYDAKTHKEIKKVNIGHGAAGILMDPDGSRAFVACTPDNYIAIVDLKTFKVTGHIDVGGGPDGLAWAVQR